MAEIIKREFPLAVLVLSLERGGAVEQRSRHAGVLRCEVQVNEVSLDTLELDAAADLGLPVSFEDAQRYRHAEPVMGLPGSFLEALRARLVGVSIAQRPLWLQFDYPNGALPLVPWERLLAPVAPGGVLRMPYHVTRPEASPESLDVALVVTSPDAKRRFGVEVLAEHHLNEILSTSPVDTRIHVFADLAIVDGLRSRWNASAPTDSRVVVHDPRDAPRLRESREEPVDAAEAWFPWIARALEGQSVDVLHVVSHGYVGSNQGMLVMADAPERPEGRADADMIGARALHTLSRSIGAWCTILTSPPTNYSVLGHRLLADALARHRPGPVGLLEMRGVPMPGVLGETYRFLCGYTTDPPVHPDLLIYVHPARTGTPEELAEASHPSLVAWQTLREDFSAANGIGAEMLRKGRGAPQWLASYQRGLEQAGSALEQRAKGGVRRAAAMPSAAERGAEEALRFLSKTVQARSEDVEGEGTAR